MKHSCGYGLVQYIGVDDENGTVFSIVMDVYDISSLKEAKRWLDKKFNLESQAQYQGYNNMLPKGAPEVFKSYFDTSTLQKEDVSKREKDEIRKLLEEKKSNEGQNIQGENGLKKKRQIFWNRPV